MIVFIPFSAVEGKPWEEWILRVCPRCGQASILGHGRRWKQAHDENHVRIRIRRGICRACHLTFTFLPVWCLPYTHYTVACRQQAMALHARHNRVEPPLVKDSERMPDESTVRRWIAERITTLTQWLDAHDAGRRPSTILAWDRARKRRIVNRKEDHNHGPPGVG